MAVVADRVIVELEAKLDRYDHNLRRAEQRFDQTTRSIRGDMNRTERQVRASSGAIGNTLRTMAASFAAAFSVREIVRMSDSFTEFQNRLRVAGLEGDRFAGVQEELFQQAQRYGVELRSLGTLYGRLALAQNALGASDEQLLQFTSSVAAALRAQGTSAEAAQGALLQLSQAIGGSVVRAEEFNSLLEGALPLVQAAAENIDGMGGSVARLREAVADGEISSRQFFEAILAGSDELESRANRAVLTISQSFTVLSNALTRYIGEAGKTSGAAQTLAIAIRTLADNIDFLIPSITALVAIAGGRLVVAAIVAQGALAGTAAQMGLVGAASFALQARAAGAATSLQTLGFAARGASVLLGGIGIAAVAAGLIYLSQESARAEARIEGIEEAARNAAATADIYEQRLREAGVASETAGDGAQSAAGRFVTMANAMWTATLRAIGLRQSLDQLALSRVRRQREITRDEQNTITARGAQRQRTIANQTRTGDALASGPNAELNQRDRREQSALELRDRELARQERALEQAVAAGAEISGPETPPSGGAPPASSGRTRSGRATPASSDRQLAFERARDSLYDRLLSAQQGEATRAEEIEGIELERLERRHAQVRAEIERDADLNAAQRAQLNSINDQTHQHERSAVLLAQRERMREDELALAVATGQTEQEILRGQADLADTQSERRRIELQILELENRERRARLEGVIASEASTETQKEIARRQLAALDRLATTEAERVRRQTAGPGEAYLDELTQSAEEAQEAFEKLQVDGLRGLEDGIVGLVPEIEFLGGAFDDFVNGVIHDLARIAIQQALIKPLADSLFGGGGGGGGGGGFFSSLGSLFGGAGGGSDNLKSIGVSPTGIGTFPGRASGGNVIGGKMYRVNEGATDGRVEGFMPAGSGQIVPLGRMNVSGSIGNGAPAPVEIRMYVEEGGTFVPRVQALSAGVTVQVMTEAAPGIADAASARTIEELTGRKL